MAMSQKTKTKAPGKAAKAPKAHPTYNSMITKAIEELNDRKGSSRIAITKYIQANYPVGANETHVHNLIRMGLRRCLENGDIVHAKGGVGATGSFKMAKSENTKPKAKKQKKVEEGSSESESDDDNENQPSGSSKASTPSKQSPKKKKASSKKVHESPQKKKAATPKKKAVTPEKKKAQGSPEKKGVKKAVATDPKKTARKAKK